MNPGYVASSKDMSNKEQVLRQAEALASRDQWKEAASLLREYQQTNFLSLEALGQLAYFCSRAGDYDSAISLYQDLCRQQPSEARWFYALGFQYQQKEQWPDAIAAYEESLRLAPRWLKAALQLGDSYRETEQVEKALNTYRQGTQNYQELSLDRRRGLASVYAKLCVSAGRMLLGKSNRSPSELEEAMGLFQQSVEAEPRDADNWYRLGCALLEADRLDEALDRLQRAETLDPKKDYIHHKIAQAHLKKKNPDEALRAYEKIPQYKRVPYILHGMAQCYMAKGENMEAAKKFYQAIQKEPGKFYHYRDFGLALIALDARDQAIEALEQSNKLFRQEYGKDDRKVLAKLEEIRSTLPPGERISFDAPASAVAEIRFGTVSRYNTERGFGFIRDDADGANVFFHITCVKERIAPQTGTRTKYVRETGEKGLQAAKVWLLKNR